VSPPRLVRQVLIATVLGVLVAAGLLAMASLPATLEALARFPWRLVPVVLLAVATNWALRFAKWHFYLNRLAIPLAPGPSLLVFLAGFTMAISPGKLGEVLKAVLVRERVGTEVSRTAAAVMAERLTDVAGLLALSALGATALPHGPALLGALAAALALAVIGFRSRALTGWARRRAPARLLAARAVEPLRAFVHGGRALLEPGALAAAVALSVASWFFECLAFALILHGLGAALPIGLATCLYAFASLAGAVSMLPGGLGVAEGSLTALLAGVGTPLADAAAATLLVRLATLWLAVALGIATLSLAFGREPAGTAGSGAPVRP
jgi:uncharacterized membrane protein YbhN (UPF0104 family)